MIRGAQYMAKAPVSTFPDVFLSKVLEQGFGCNVRQNMTRGADCLPAVQETLNRLIAIPQVSGSLDSKTQSLLRDLQTFQIEPNGFPKVNEATAEALLRLMILHDPYLAENIYESDDMRRIDFVMVTEADLPWFRLLHSLEIYGVVTGVQEFPVPVSLEDGNVGGEKELKVEKDLDDIEFRVFMVDRSKLAAYRAEDGDRFAAAIETIKSARRIDQDAHILLRQLTA